MNNKLTIRIRNWEKYQAAKKRNDREWIKLQTNIIHDPDFFELSITDRYTWIGLLLHAGRVGPEFKLSLSQTRVLLKLNRNPSFQCLIDQGFIEVLPREEKRKKRKKRVPAPKTPAPSIEAIMYPEGLNREAWEKYVAHRKDINKKKLTTKGAWQAMKTWSMSSPEAQMRAVEDSIANGYTGCWPKNFMPGRGKETPLAKLNREMGEQDANQ